VHVVTSVYVGAADGFQSHHTGVWKLSGPWDAMRHNIDLTGRNGKVELALARLGLVTRRQH